MTLTDLLLIACVLASAAVLLVVIFRALRGRLAAAGRLLGAWILFAAGYLLIGLGVSGLRAQRIIPTSEPWCFDDWCLTVGAVEHVPAPTGSRIALDLVVSSRAKRITQRARGAWIYLIDSLGHRYAPEADPSTTPLDVELTPGQADTTTRVFDLPAGAKPAGLITGHGGPYCGVMDILVIGEAGCLFGKPTMIAIK